MNQLEPSVWLVVRAVLTACKSLFCTAINIQPNYENFKKVAALSKRLLMKLRHNSKGVFCLQHAGLIGNPAIILFPMAFPINVRSVGIAFL